jgi:hypothetical protein
MQKSRANSFALAAPARRQRAAACRGRLAALFLLGGLLFAAVGMAHLTKAAAINRPDAAVFMRKYIHMTLPMIFSAVGLLLAGAYQAYRAGQETRLPSDSNSAHASPRETGITGGFHP